MVFDGSRGYLLLMILLLELQFSEIETREIVQRSSIFEQGEYPNVQLATWFHPERVLSMP
jgi:hypothetical protein